MEPWRRLDQATTEDARARLFACCGSTRWATLMLARRPFGSMDRLLADANDVWNALSEDDWKEAFSHHPRIGERNLAQAKFAATRALSEQEQAGLSGASDDVLGALAAVNREYEDRFGYVFLICATGRTAAEMLSIARERLTNDPATEIRIAAAEQATITALRLERQ
jgi:2-oxo-4-hydroxy-4-carboxy-5-ureidoimidazoline decarboxylase